MELVSTVTADAGIYIQVARFFLTLAAGALITRLLLMPFARRIVSRRGDKKAASSVESLAGVTGLFLSFTVALQAGSFGGLATIIGAIAAALTVAVGFGMRDQVSSIMGGVFIHLDSPFVRGDYVSVGELEGEVSEIGLRETVLNGRSREKVIVPNSKMVSEPVRNWTKGRRTRSATEVSVSPEDVDDHVSVFREVLEAEEDVLERPEPSVSVKNVVDGEAVLEPVYWISDSDDVREVRSDVLRSYLERCVEEGLIKEESE